jgi:hypothetical protein
MRVLPRSSFSKAVRATLMRAGPLSHSSADATSFPQALGSTRSKLQHLYLDRSLVAVQSIHYR